MGSWFIGFDLRCWRVLDSDGTRVEVGDEVRGVGDGVSVPVWWWVPVDELVPSDGGSFAVVVDDVCAVVVE